MPTDFKRRTLPLGQLRLPAPGTVHLWYLDLAELGNPLHRDAGKATRLDQSPRQQRTLRRFYLRLLLGAYLGLPGKDVKISRLIKGKPVLAGMGDPPPLDFSMANSDGCCLVGVTREGLLGVDLEREGRRVDAPARLAARYFSPDEARALGGLEPADADRAFLHTWACKEALVKAAGHGIADQLHRFAVSCDPGVPARVLSMLDDDPAAWRLAMVRPSGRHLGAVALRQPGLAIAAFRLAPPA